jgi:hypothetical protein
MPLTLSRSLIVVLVPGLVTIAPWVLLFAMYAPRITHAYDTHVVAGNALLFALVVVVGSVLEGLGSYREERWDSQREKEFEVQENWYKYLALTPSVEPAGFRYLSRSVTTMYFELSMALAGSSLLVGVAAILLTLEWVPAYSVAGVLVGLAVFSTRFFYSQAHDSHKNLCKVRKELAIRLPKEPVDAS